jgi:HEAT repeat protein
MKYLITIVVLLFFCVNNLYSESDIDTLIGNSKSQERSVRLQATENLGKIHTDVTYNRLLELLKDEDDGIVWAASESLAQHNRKESIPALMAAIKRSTNLGNNYVGYIAKILYSFNDPSLLDFWAEAVLYNDKDVVEWATRVLVENNYQTKKVIANLQKAARSDNESIRETTLYALVYFNDQSSFGVYKDRLIDASSEVRALAIIGLGRLKDKRATAYCLVMLEDEEYCVQRAALQSLCLLADSRALFGLFPFLDHSDKSLVQYAVIALGQTRRSEAVPELLKYSHTDDMFLKVAIIEALGKIGDSRAVPFLEESLAFYENSRELFAKSTGGSRGYTLFIAEKEMPYIESPVLHTKVSNNGLFLKDIEDDVLLTDLSYCNEVLVVIKKALQNISESGSVSREESYSLSEYNAFISEARKQMQDSSADSVQVLISDLATVDSESRKRDIIRSLSKPRNNDAVPVLVPVVLDQKEDEYVRTYAINALGVIAAQESIDPLKQLLTNSDVPKSLRESSARALALIGDTHANIDLIRFLLFEQSSDTASNVITHLTHEKRTVWLQLVNELLLSENDKLCKTTLWALMYISDDLRKKNKSTWSYALKRLLQSSDQRMREDAIGIVGSIKDESAIPVLENLYSVAEESEKAAIVSALRYIGSEKGLMLLQRALVDKSEWVKQSAVDAVKVIKKNKESDVFDALQNADQIDDVLKVQMLMNSQKISEKNIDYLESLLKQSNVLLRVKALKVLEEGFYAGIPTTSAKIRNIYKEALSDPSFMVQAYAATKLSGQFELDEAVIAILQKVVRDEEYVKLLDENSDVPALVDMENDPELIEEHFIKMGICSDAVITLIMNGNDLPDNKVINAFKEKMDFNEPVFGFSSLERLMTTPSKDK